MMGKEMERVKEKREEKREKRRVEKKGGEEREVKREEEREEGRGGESSGEEKGRAEEKREKTTPREEERGSFMSPSNEDGRGAPGLRDSKSSAVFISTSKSASAKERETYQRGFILSSSLSLCLSSRI